MEENYLPFSRPLYLMAKPVGWACNMACRYCYYMDKSDIYEAVKRPRMSSSMLETFIRRYIEAQTTPWVQFTWHGGEATLMPLDFYRRALELQQRYSGGREIYNCLQTNGLLINHEWARFLAENKWLVGLSIDGPQDMHDHYRRLVGGQPSWARVMHAITLFDRYGVEWNAMAAINDVNSRYPERFYEFFRSIGCAYIQFTPVVERIDSAGHIAPVDVGGIAMAPFSVRPDVWGEFLCGVYDLWVRSDVGRRYVQLFDAILANRVGVTPGVCSMARECGHAAVMEHNGDVYSCDHFVFPQYKLGNIGEQTLVEMLLSERQQQFGRLKQESLPAECRACPYLQLCNGECPKNRFALTASGAPGLNYLCEGYRRFFAHTAADFDYMARELAAKRPPSNIMLTKR